MITSTLFNNFLCQFKFFFSTLCWATIIDSKRYIKRIMLFCSVNNCIKFCRSFQGLLGYQALLNQDVITSEVVDSLSDKIPTLLAHLKSAMKRKDGMGMKIPKCHLQLHIPRYIKLFGVPKIGMQKQQRKTINTK